MARLMVDRLCEKAMMEMQVASYDEFQWVYDV